MAKIGDHVDTIYGVGTVISGKRIMLHQQNEKIISYEGDKDRDRKRRIIRGVLRTRLQVEELSTSVFKKFIKDNEKIEKELQKEKSKEEKEKLKIEKEKIKQLKLAHKEAKEKLKPTKIDRKAVKIETVDRSFTI
jgi:hypothetical protein